MYGARRTHYWSWRRDTERQKKKAEVVSYNTAKVLTVLRGCPYHYHSHLEYIVDGVTYMRMKFHVAGSKRKGTVFIDLKKVR